MPAGVVAVLAGLTDGPVDVGALEAVWVNGVGGQTFRADDLYVKWAPAGTDQDLEAEAVRLAWASRWTPVPDVVGHGADETGQWLVTRAMPGRNAVDPVWVARPAQAARELGVALRALHDALPVAECPFDWGVPARLARAGVPAEAAAALVGPVPPVERLVVCHGDACAPNTLLADDGTWTGHLDLGALGVADLWADLAIIAWSTEWNYGPGFEDDVYAGYGIEPDPERIAFYRRLWNAT